MARMLPLDLAQYVKDCGAIVTEQGGLLSHAAVTAREFCLPAIVGVSDALQQFFDGDLVEVDAERGIVTILKRTDAA